MLSYHPESRETPHPNTIPRRTRIYRAQVAPLCQHSRSRTRPGERLLMLISPHLGASNPVPAAPKTLFKLRFRICNGFSSRTRARRFTEARIAACCIPCLGDDSRMNDTQTTPTDDQVQAAANAIRAKDPDLGRAKLLSRLKAENGWILSEARLKKLVPSVNVSSGTTVTDTKYPEINTTPHYRSLPPPSLPADALSAQQAYKAADRRCFKLYGRAEHDFGVTPNSDMGVLIAMLHARLVKAGRPQTKAEKAALAQSRPMLLLWAFYYAAASVAGIPKEDLGRQLEAEYGVNPLPYLASEKGAQDDDSNGFAPQDIEDALKVLVNKEAGLDGLPYELLAIIGSKALTAVLNDVWRNGMMSAPQVLVTKIGKRDGLQEFGDVN
ncbi:hypothetical protein MKEN_00009400 [Mycena kentingensis (nom. inval.)]|nr:hypothetical protein MKEN_00009400 [Mycena kentingensis (nom. inval.)]